MTVNRRVFCVEGNWDPKNLRVPGGMQRMLEHVQYCVDKTGRGVYRTFGTAKELEYLVKLWAKGYSDCGILYIAGHGKSGLVICADKEITLHSLGEWMGSRAEGRFVHFGTCSTLADSDSAQSLLKNCKLAGYSGYAEACSWIDSTAFEQYYFSLLLTHYAKDGKYFAPARLTKMEREYREVFQKDFLTKKLGFKISWPGRES